ncbi:MAG: four helix bundle protein [Patescibacteria group bacterium]
MFTQRPYEKLVAWQEAFNLCLWIYELTKKFPSEEKFALVSQMRRSAYSVPMNLAEGNVKHSKKDKARFFENALASLEELHCQCRIALGLHYITQDDFKKADDHIQRVGYLIYKLRSSLS